MGSKEDTEFIAGVCIIALLLVGVLFPLFASGTYADKVLIGAVTFLLGLMVAGGMMHFLFYDSREQESDEDSRTSPRREPIPPSVRFEVLRRDGFRCQYCGRSSSDGDVILEVDHIVPVSKGGTNDLNNLITSCRECNRGKGAREPWQ